MFLYFFLEFVMFKNKFNIFILYVIVLKFNFFFVEFFIVLFLIFFGESLME